MYFQSRAVMAFARQPCQRVIHNVRPRKRPPSRVLVPLTVLSVFSVFAYAPANCQTPDALEHVWRHKAGHYINLIRDEDNQSRALYEFTPVRLWAGDVQGASDDAPRIANPQLRGYAHYQIARYRKAAGDFPGAVREVRAAEPSALARGYAYPHVDACLDIAESLDMAKSYVSRVLAANPRESSSAYHSLIGALAKRGMLDEALRIVNDLPKRQQPKAVARIARETASRADIDKTTMLLKRLTNDSDKDNTLINLIRSLKDHGHTEAALKYVEDIRDPVTRHKAKHLTNRMRGKPISELTIHDLEQQIAAEESPEVRQQLTQTLLGRHLKNRNVDAAAATIASMVDLIQHAGFREETSKFGNTTDAVRIALAELNYLQIAKIHAESGEVEKGRAALQRAKQALTAMPDSSGITKMMSVPGVLAAQIQFGEIDAVRESVRTLQPAFWQQQAPFLAETFLKHGDTEMATWIAESILGGQGAGGAEIIAAFVRNKQMQTARQLLNSVNIESHAGHDACRQLGATMFETGHTAILETWLTELSPEIAAHLCIGAARMAGSYLLPPAHAEEEAVVAFLEIGDELPAEYHLAEKPFPNPGIYRGTSLPIVAKGLQRHRLGDAVPLTMAARAVFVSNGHEDIRVQVYQLNDADIAKRTVDEMYIMPFAAGYLRKGRCIIFIDAEHWPEREAAGERIQVILTERKLMTEP